jgi:hypothetical protein
MEAGMEATEAKASDTKLVEITVNTKSVSMNKGKATGLEIKETAIAQGVNIRNDFVLFEEVGKSQRRVVGDNDVVNIHTGSSFEAIPHDDNS